jgi:tripartite ATP-independent transporter DctP family solute receptor
VKERSGGSLDVEIFPSGQLGDEREIIEGLQQGTIHLTSVSNGVVSAFDKDFMLLDIPFLFEDEAAARRAIDSAAEETLFKNLGDIGLLGLAIWEQGFRNVSSSEKPVAGLDDLRGLKLRTMEAPLHVEAWRAAGANPTPMSWSQVYPSLQQGVIDGQENPLYVVTQEKLYEVQKYVSLTRHIYDAMPVLASKTWFDSLPADQQRIVTETIREVTSYERQLAEQLVSEAAKELPSKGVSVVELDPARRAEIAAAAQGPVIERVKATLGNEVVDAWLAAAKQ